MVKRLLAIILTIAMCAAVIAGCGAPTQNKENAAADTKESAANSADTITIVDHTDAEVVVPKNISRIAVCDIVPLPSVLTVFFDSAEKIVGMSPVSMSAAENSIISKLYPEILEAKTGYIEGTSVNVEELMALKPDVVFYSAASPELGEQLKNAGFAAVAISVNKWEYNCIETLDNWLALLGEMFPENDKRELVREYSDAAYDMVQERVSALSEEERARLFFLFKYSDSAMMTSGERFFGQWWCDAIGAVNVAKELEIENEASVNLEQVYAWQPEVMLISNFTPAQPEDIYGNTIGAYDWSGIEAVKEKRVYKMPLGMYRSYTPGVDTPVTLKWMAKTVYPELFEDVDITAEVKSYYKDIFGIELTDEEAESIFAPVADAAAGFNTGK